LLLVVHIIICFRNIEHLYSVTHDSAELVLDWYVVTKSIYL